MLIIFDLDDTLIDTSGSIVPTRLKCALQRMVQAGLKLENPKLQLKKILDINIRSVSAKEALKEFLTSLGETDKFLNVGLDAIYNQFDPEIKVKPRKGANKILNELKKNHELALVSVGNDQFQRLKLKSAGIDFSIFSIIEVIQIEDKKPVYQNIINTLRKKVDETIVCGDKITVDLMPAKELNCITVHMQYGRGKNFTTFDRSLIDFEIKELDELKNIIKIFGG